MTKEPKRINLEKAPVDTLRMFAVTVLGLDIGSEGKDAVIAKMKSAGYGLDTIAIMEAPEIVDVNKASERRGDAMDLSEIIVEDGTDEFNLKRIRRFVNIRIPASEAPGGHRPVPINVNGNNLYVARNTESLVPEEHVEALMHATEIRYEPNHSNDLEPLAEGRIVSRYPFQRIPITIDEPINPKTKRPHVISDREALKDYRTKRQAEETRQAKARADNLRKRGLVDG
jgi:hypothetical protein